MTKEELEEKARDYIDRCTKSAGFVILPEQLKQDFIDLYVAGAEFGYNKCNEQLTKAKELLTKWVELFKPKGGNIPPTPIQVETEQFLREVEE